MFNLFEKVKQQLHISERTFKPTCNARNQAMFRELITFCVSLKQLQKVVQTYVKDVPDTLERLKTLMQAPLPQIYQEGPDGLPKPVGEEPVPIGSGVDIEKLSTSGKDFRARAEKDIVKHIKDWMHNFKRAQLDMDQLERMRLALDAHRRKFHSMKAKYERAKEQSENPSTRSSVDLMAAYNKLHHQEEKMNGADRSFTEMEEAVAQSLQQLAATSVQIQDEAATLLYALQDCFQNAYFSFDGQYPPDSQTVEPVGKPLAALVNVPLTDDRAQIDRRARAQEIFVAAGGAFAEAGRSRQGRSSRSVKNSSAPPAQDMQAAGRSDVGGPGSPGSQPLSRGGWAQPRDQVPMASAWPRSVSGHELAPPTPHGGPSSRGHYGYAA